MSEQRPVTTGVELPKLDPTDLQAVRSFLPGKLIGRTAALLSLVALLLGFAVTADVSLAKLQIVLSPKAILTLGALLVLAVAVQLVLEWRAKKTQTLARDLAARDDARLDGYFRIGPYTSAGQDRRDFSRADRAAERTLEWLLRARPGLLYLTGDSGVGKSSLLNAVVIPKLRDRKWGITQCRVWQQLDATIESITVAQSDTGSTLTNHLIVIDQFEEFLIVHDPARDNKLAWTLDAIDRQPHHGIRVLLVLRNDYLTLLDEFGLPPLRQEENWQPISPFTVTAGLTFMAEGGLGLPKTALLPIVISASELDGTPSLVRPITLNIIGHVLQGTNAAPSLDAGTLIRRYIEQAVCQHGIRDVAPRVLLHLVTDKATKRTRNEQELIAATRLRRGEVRAVLNGLAIAGLARPLDHDHAVWELSHDFIAAAIARYLGHRRRNFRRLAGYLTPASLLLAASLTYAWDRDDPLVLMPPRQEPIAFLAGPQPTDSISGASLSFVNGAKIQQDPVLKRNAFYFPGNGAMVTLNIPQLPSGNRERTIALWAYATRDPGISGAEAFLAGYGGFRDSGDTYDVYARDGGAISLSNWGDAVTVPGFTLNRWICVAAVTRPAGSSRAVDTIYLQDEQNSLDMPTNTAASQTFFVGGHDRGRTLFGYIRDVAVFDVALSKRNIAYLCHHPDWEPKGG